MLLLFSCAIANFLSSRMGCRCNVLPAQSSQTFIPDKFRIVRWTTSLSTLCGSKMRAEDFNIDLPCILTRLMNCVFYEGFVLKYPSY